MQFFGEAVNVLQTLVIALGAGLCVWGGINLMEGYGNDIVNNSWHIFLKHSHTYAVISKEL